MWVATGDEVTCDGFFRPVRRGFCLPIGTETTEDMLDAHESVAALVLTPLWRADDGAPVPTRPPTGS